MKRFVVYLLLLFAFTLTGCQIGEVSGEMFPTASIVSHPAVTVEISHPLVVGMDIQQEISTKSLLYADPYTYVLPRPQVLPNVLDFERGVLTLESSQKQEPTEHFDDVQGMDFTKEIVSYGVETQEPMILGTVVGNTQLPHGFSTSDSYFDFTVDNGLTITEYYRDGSSQHTIFSIPGGLGAYGIQLSSGERIFLIHHLVDDEDRETILKLGHDGDTTILLDGTQANESYGYSAIAACGEDIYVAKQAVVSGNLETSIVVLDKNGETQETLVLPGLEQYKNSEYYADRLYVVEKFLFLKWYRADDSAPYMTIYALQDGTPRQISFGTSSPSALLHVDPIENRFLFFRAFPENMDYQDTSYERELIVFDMQTEQLKKVIIDCEPGYKILQKDVDSDGTIFIYLTPIQKESGLTPKYMKVQWGDIRLLLLAH